MADNLSPGNEPAANPESEPGGTLGRRPALPLIGALLAAVAIGVLLVVIAIGGGGGSDDDGTDAALADKPSAGLDTEIPTLVATIPVLPTPVATVGTARVGPSDRFIIRKLGVDAPITLKSVGLDGQMPDPDGPDDVAYYDFSAWPGLGGGPGTGGNAVFAGHVDSGRKACKNGSVKPPCQAVLWDLKKLLPGDEIEVKVSGVSHIYRVTGGQALDPTDVRPVVTSSAQESITIITCTGEFRNGEYTSRWVVGALKV